MNRSLLQRDAGVPHPEGIRDKARSKMTGRFHRCISASISTERATFRPDNVRMIARRGRSWMIGAIALAAVLLAGVSSSTAIKLRKPRLWPTTKLPYQSGPVIVRVVHKYSDDDDDDELAHTAAANCTRGNCRKFENADVGGARSERRNALPDERYVVYPKKYEHFVSRKSTGHANRYRRYVEFSEARALNTSRSATPEHDREDASEGSRRESNKSKLKKVITLYKVRKHVQTKDSRKPLDEASRTRRSAVGDYTARRNSSDYYAERRAVMERYYARQREINARYSKQASNATRLQRNGTSQIHPVANGIAPFRFNREYPGKNSTAIEKATFRNPSIKIDPIYSNELENGNAILGKPDDRQGVTRETNLGFKSWNGSNVERNSLYNHVTPTPLYNHVTPTPLYNHVTPTPCTNATLSGSLEPKTRSKHADTSGPRLNESEEIRDRTTTFRPINNGDPETDHQTWGQCQGKIVYQHNLLLGLKGPSTLDTVFEVIIQGVCITCVKVLRYNNTRAWVTLDSGGRGHEFAKFRLRGFENEGFSYIIKIWGVRKVDPHCSNIK